MMMWRVSRVACAQQLTTADNDTFEHGLPSWDMPTDWQNISAIAGAWCPLYILLSVFLLVIESFEPICLPIKHGKERTWEFVLKTFNQTEIRIDNENDEHTITAMINWNLSLSSRISPYTNVRDQPDAAYAEDERETCIWWKWRCCTQDCAFTMIQNHAHEQAQQARNRRARKEASVVLMKMKIW